MVLTPRSINHTAGAIEPLKLYRWLANEFFLGGKQGHDVRSTWSTTLVYNAQTKFTIHCHWEESFVEASVLKPGLGCRI